MPQLDDLIPQPDIAERHSIRISAPADVVFKAACALNLQDSWLIRTIIRTRELVLRAAPSPPMPRTGIIQQTQAIGWTIVAETPNQEIIMGASTQPWSANVTFRPPTVAPGFVNIYWTLRVNRISDSETLLTTETHARATDPESSRQFRRYWRIFSPGIILIRLAALRQIKRNIEHPFVFRALSIWAIFMTCEVIHGTFRVLVMAPLLGDFRARQVAAITASCIVLGITTLFSNWLGTRAYNTVGFFWLALTLAFEFGVGRLTGMSWHRILEDYNLLAGGLLAPAMIVLVLAPRIAAAIRKRRYTSAQCITNASSSPSR